MAGRVQLISLCIVILAVTGDVIARSPKRRSYKQAFFKIKRNLRTCSGGMHLCAFNATQERWCGAIQCIPESQLCDGIPNCPYLDDEKNCPPTCDDDYIICPNKRKCAVPCDDCEECEHGEDEKFCKKDKPIGSHSEVNTTCCPKNSNKTLVCFPLDETQSSPIRGTACNNQPECLHGRDEWPGCRFCSCTINDALSCCEPPATRYETPCVCPDGEQICPSQPQPGS